MYAVSVDGKGVLRLIYPFVSIVMSVGAFVKGHSDHLKNASVGKSLITTSHRIFFTIYTYTYPQPFGFSTGVNAPSCY